MNGPARMMKEREAESQTFYEIKAQRDALLKAAKRTAAALRDLNNDIRYLVYADDLDKAILEAETKQKP